eukprot:13049412-Heterocapsa_arctica.AAC.1
MLLIVDGIVTTLAFRRILWRFRTRSSIIVSVLRAHSLGIVPTTPGLPWPWRRGWRSTTRRRNRRRGG